jgi:Tfp pilus assembly protein PilX
MIKLRQQRGAALFVGIFLITVVVLFAAVVALTSSTQHLSQARSGLATQAWYTAVARAETGLQAAVCDDLCPTSSSSSVQGFSTLLSCQSVSVQEGGDTYTVFDINVSASQGGLGNAVFVRRTLRAQATDTGDPAC